MEKIHREKIRKNSSNSSNSSNSCGSDSSHSSRRRSSNSHSSSSRKSGGGGEVGPSYRLGRVYGQWHWGDSRATPFVSLLPSKRSTLRVGSPEQVMNPMELLVFSNWACSPVRPRSTVCPPPAVVYSCISFPWRSGIDAQQYHVS